QAQQVVLAHDALYPLAIHRPAALLQFVGDPPAAVSRPFQRHPLYGVAQHQLLARYRDRQPMPIKPGAADFRQIAHPLHPQTSSRGDFPLDLFVDRAPPASARSWRCSMLVGMSKWTYVGPG